MANKKFSEFDVSSDIVDVTELVGLNGASNIKITPTNLLADVNSDIADNTQAITDEETARISADTDLANDIVAEETAREDADTNLQNQINSVSNIALNAVQRSEANDPLGYPQLDSGARIENEQMPVVITPTTIFNELLNGQDIFATTVNTANVNVSATANISNLDVSTQTNVSQIKSFTLSTFFNVPQFGGTVNWYSFGSLPNRSGLLSVSSNSSVRIYNFATGNNTDLNIGASVGYFGNGAMSLNVVNGNQLQIRNDFFTAYSGTFTLKILYLD